MKCSFCSMNRMYGPSFRAYAIERVLRDIEDLYRRGARHVFILDDNITLDVRRLMELCEAIAALKRPEMQFVIQASSAGIARVRYRVGATTYTREVFASAPHQVIVVHMTADGRLLLVTHGDLFDAAVQGARTRAGQATSSSRSSARARVSRLKYV